MYNGLTNNEINSIGNFIETMEDFDKYTNYQKYPNAPTFTSDRIGTFCEKCRNVICVCGQVQAFKDSIENNKMKQCECSNPTQGVDNTK